MFDTTGARPSSPQSLLMQNPVEESKLGISLLVPSGVFEAAGSSHFVASLLCILTF